MKYDSHVWKETYTYEKRPTNMQREPPFGEVTKTYENTYEKTYEKRITRPRHMKIHMKTHMKRESHITASLKWIQNPRKRNQTKIHFAPQEYLKMTNCTGFFDRQNPKISSCCFLKSPKISGRMRRESHKSRETWVLWTSPLERDL